MEGGLLLALLDSSTFALLAEMSSKFGAAFVFKSTPDSIFSSFLKSFPPEGVDGPKMNSAFFTKLTPFQ